MPRPAKEEPIEQITVRLSKADYETLLRDCLVKGYIYGDGPYWQQYFASVAESIRQRKTEIPKKS